MIDFSSKPGDDRIERIEHYERIYQQLRDAVTELEKAFHTWAELQQKCRELEEYYTGSLWKQDYSADENGELPKDLKRSILSEDGINDLLDDNVRWLRLLNMDRNVFAGHGRPENQTGIERDVT